MADDNVADDSGGGLVRGGERRQYMSFTAPLVIPNTVTPPPSGIAAILTRRPDVVRSARELTAAHAPHFFAGYVPSGGTVATGTGTIYQGDWSVIDRPVLMQYQAIVGPVMKATPRTTWDPTYPHRIPRNLRRAQFAPYFGGFGIPATTTTSNTLPKSIFPDAISRKANVAWMPFRDSGIDTTQIPVPVVPNFGGLISVYPNSIYRRTMLTANHMVTASGSQVSIFPIDPLTWKPTFADSVGRQKFHAAFQVPSIETFGSQGAVEPTLAWHPVYPDYIWPKRRALQQEWGMELMQGDFVVPDLSWGPQFPDFVVRTKFSTALQLGRNEPSISIYPVTPLPTPIAPDYIFRKQYPAAAQRALFFIVPKAPAPELSWGGYQPDWIARKVSPRWTWVTDVSTDANRPLPDHSWVGWYPDSIARRTYPAALQLPSIIGSYGTISVPTFTPQFIGPDRYRQLRGLHASGQMFTAFPASPQPNSASPASAWTPRYPDFARRSLLHASQVPYHFWPDQFSPLPTFGWATQSVTPIRAVKGPAGDITRPISSAASTPNWAVSYPSQFPKPALGPRFSPTVESPISTQLIIPQFRWESTYPDRIFRPFPTIAEFSVFISPVSPVDCITLFHESSSYSDLFLESGTYTDLVDESVTITTPTGEEFC